MRGKRRTVRRPGAAALGLLMLLAAGGVQAAPQTFNTALPVATGEFIFRGQFLYKSAGGDPSPLNRSLDVRGGAAAVGYGVTSSLAVFGVLPFLSRELDVTLPGGERVSRDTSGVADARLFGRYTLFRQDRRGSTFRIAPFAGLEVPTGDDDDADDLGVLPPTLQLGSGSWDPFVGAVATYQTLDYQLNGQAAYKANTEAYEFEFGDEFRLDASVQYRLWPRELGAGVPGFFLAGLEANFLYQGRNRMAGIGDADSGGHSFFLAPSLQYGTKRWVLEAIVQVPVAQDLNGTALEHDVTVRAGFRFNY